VSGVRARGRRNRWGIGDGSGGSRASCRTKRARCSRAMQRGRETRSASYRSTRASPLAPELARNASSGLVQGLLGQAAGSDALTLRSMYTDERTHQVQHYSKRRSRGRIATGPPTRRRYKGQRLASELEARHARPSAWRASRRPARTVNETWKRRGPYSRRGRCGIDACAPTRRSQCAWPDPG
jgi:hypothetical protein